MKNNEKGYLKKTLVLANYVLITSIALFAGLILFVFFGYRQINDFLEPIKQYGSIGDALSGTITPIMTFMGSILIYLTLRAQVQVNNENQLSIIRNQNDLAILSILNFLKESVENFSCEDNSGSSGIYCFLQKNYCAGNHGFDPNQEVGEFYAILDLFVLLISKIDDLDSNIKKEVSETLAVLFKYKIAYFFYENNNFDFDGRSCQECNAQHGLPVKAVNKLNSIKKYLASYLND